MAGRAACLTLKGAVPGRLDKSDAGSPACHYSRNCRKTSTPHIEMVNRKNFSRISLNAAVPKVQEVTCVAGTRTPPMRRPLAGSQRDLA
jgi:hypothetical protein